MTRGTMNYKESVTYALLDIEAAINKPASEEYLKGVEVEKLVSFYN